MNESDKRSILSYCSEKRLSADEVLFEYGEPSLTLYLLAEGRLAVHKFTGFEEKMQVVALLDNATVVCESALLEKKYHKTKVTVIESALLYCLTQEKHQILQKENPALAARFLEYLLGVVSLRLEKTSERLAHIL